MTKNPEASRPRKKATTGMAAFYSEVNFICVFFHILHYSNIKGAMGC